MITSENAQTLQQLVTGVVEDVGDLADRKSQIHSPCEKGDLDSAEGQGQ